MCQPELQLPFGFLTALLFAISTFMLVRRVGGRKSSDDVPTNETRVFLLLVVALLVSVNLEFGPQLASRITGRGPTIEAGMLESHYGHGRNRSLFNKVCVSGKCFSAPTIDQLGVEKGAAGILYSVDFLNVQRANGRLFIWPDTGLGGARVKSLQICDPDWIARARVKWKHMQHLDGPKQRSGLV
jgi:hypothetical protein